MVPEIEAVGIGSLHQKVLGPTFRHPVGSNYAVGWKMLEIERLGWDHCIKKYLVQLSDIQWDPIMQLAGKCLK